ncbi:MAG: hypothetical protein KBC95_01580 [Candidatus Peribacteraceae bacterium]|nr:hypothetical protein [Candidatus Peribacteraceae bacterium]
MTDATPTTDQPVYLDDDLVYVDPDARAVIGRVEFDEKGMPKKLARPPREFPMAPAAPGAATPAPAAPVEADGDDDDEPAAAPAPAAAAKGGRGRGRDRERRPRKPKVRYYPWGTYRSMKKIFKVAGKVPETRGQSTLDEVLPKALNEAFWDNGPAVAVAKDSASDQY